MNCTNCGTHLDNDDVFCPNCGTPVSASGQQNSNQQNPNQQNQNQQNQNQQNQNQQNPNQQNQNEYQSEYQSENAYNPEQDYPDSNYQNSRKYDPNPDLSGKTYPNEESDPAYSDHTVHMNSNNGFNGYNGGYNGGYNPGVNNTPNTPPVDFVPPRYTPNIPPKKEPKESNKGLTIAIAAAAAVLVVLIGVLAYILITSNSDSDAEELVSDSSATSTSDGAATDDASDEEDLFGGSDDTDASDSSDSESGKTTDALTEPTKDALNAVETQIEKDFSNATSHMMYWDAGSQDNSFTVHYLVQDSSSGILSSLSTVNYDLSIDTKTDEYDITQLSSDKIGESTFTSITASSTYPAYETYHYEPELMLDRSDQTAWEEGADGDGKGVTIELTSDDKRWVYGLCIKNGYIKNQMCLTKNRQVSKINVAFSDGTDMDLDLNKTTMVNGDYSNCLIFDHAVETDSITITILDTYDSSDYTDPATGTTYKKNDDTAITDIYVLQE